MISMTQPISTIVATIVLLVVNDVMAQREYILNEAFYFTSPMNEPEHLLLTGKKKPPRKETYQEANCLQLTEPCAIIYEHCNYEGNSRVIDKNAWYVGAWRWSSIRVNPGTVVTLFSDAGFGKNRPGHRYINASTACLSEQAFNDKTQSVIVETRQNLRRRMATGYQRCKKGLTTDCSAL